MTAQPQIQRDELPPLARDRSFWGMTVTQFLGAFNDNLFKQLVLLICINFAKRGGRDYQPIAMALFAIPFVLFSGLGGYLSDCTGKRRIIILCKVAEILIMLLGLAALLAGQVNPQWLLLYMLIVLFLMSTQSGFFGPAKYGILPEMLRERDLPQANGVVQMTTFVAIIFGMALAGYSKDWFQGRLWMISILCIGIAVAGTLTSLSLRKTQVAHPGLRFNLSTLAINRETWRMLRSDRPLMGVLLVSSLFWFVGGVVQQAVNAFGRLQLNYSNSRTSLLAACMGVGIAVGCLLAGKASHHRVNFRLVTIGAWGIIACLAALVWLGHIAVPLPDDGKPTVPESLAELLAPLSTTELMTRFALVGLGTFAGLFVVPLQVFVQARPPEDQKGRMIGALNLINWIGIVFSALFYQACLVSLKAFKLNISWTFAALAATMLAVALFYRPRINQA